jgi:hypothetical protein
MTVFRWLRSPIAVADRSLRGFGQSAFAGIGEAMAPALGERAPSSQIT